tara:strand:+ start:3649 stop:3903 length:255 start_codon:yes stop_codon:yes gene_type:complete
MENRGVYSLIHDIIFNNDFETRLIDKKIQKSISDFNLLNCEDINLKWIPKHFKVEEVLYHATLSNYKSNAHEKRTYKAIIKYYS